MDALSASEITHLNVLKSHQDAQMRKKLPGRTWPVCVCAPRHQGQKDQMATMTAALASCLIIVACNAFLHSTEGMASVTEHCCGEKHSVLPGHVPCSGRKLPDGAPAAAAECDM